MAITSSSNPSLNGNKNLPKGNEWQWTNRIEPIKNEFIDEIAIYQLICPIKKFTSKFQTHCHLFSITCFSLCTDKPSRYAFVIFWLCDIYSDFLLLVLRTSSARYMMILHVDDSFLLKIHECEC